MKKSSKKDVIFHVIETWLIFISLLLFILFSLSNFIFGELGLSFFNHAYQDFIQITVGTALYNLKSSLLSVAAIFIGIYVTVFTLLGSIKVDSIFAYLNENTFKKLIKYIRNAFFASFLYLVLIMVLEIQFKHYNEIHYFLIVINASLVIYMFLTALRFGVILYLSFSKDLNNLQKNLKKIKEEQRELERLRFRLEKFLDKFESEQEKKQNEKMSKIIKNKN